MNADFLSERIHIEGDMALFDGIDRDKKCYIKGIITFHPKANALWWIDDGPADPDPSHNCSTATFALCLIEIKN